MKTELIEMLARQVASGSLSVDDMMSQLAKNVTGDSPVQLDVDRSRRCGFPEVVFGEGKSPSMILDAVKALLDASQPALVTRLSAEKYEEIASQIESGSYNKQAQTLRIGNNNKRLSKTVVMAAGTSDLPVAEEAAETLHWMGGNPLRLTDIGVAGPQRLLRNLDQLSDASAIVCVAGMEGALPSVVGGYVDCPVVAVPTSVGYGANLNGFAALLSMLNCCAANVTVVNIDAGFKAGYIAGLIAQQRIKD